MKCKIEKNTVQETLILPLYSRKLCTELYPNLYRDETAVRLLDQIDYDFSEAEKNSRSLMQRFGALAVATRQSDLAFEVRDYLKDHPNAAVVNLGCGLDNTGRTCDNGRCKIYNLDFPDVIALRQQLLPAGAIITFLHCVFSLRAYLQILFYCIVKPGESQCGGRQSIFCKIFSTILHLLSFLPGI